MQTKKIAAALFAVTLLVGFAAAARAADTTPKPEESPKSCCKHARAAGEAGAHCERHADTAKACCAEHAKEGKGGDGCCCEKSCDRPAAEKKAAPKS